MSEPGATIDYLPIWKKGATPYERLMEVASIARKHPERFAKIAVVSVEDTGKADIVRYAQHGCTTMELIGLMRMAQDEVLAVTRGD